MQSLKDTFYLMLRDRVAAGNAQRTVVVRGVERAGVVVVENELPGASVAGIFVLDAFCLGWAGLSLDVKSALPIAALQCSIRYATDGTAGSAGMDRGRALTAMDEELASALGASPQFVPKVVGVTGQAAAGVGDGTNVFWGDVVFGPVVVKNERLERTATVEVYCYGE